MKFEGKELGKQNKNREKKREDKNLNKEKAKNLFGKDGEEKKEKNNDSLNGINNKFDNSSFFDGDFYYLSGALEGASIRLESDRGYSMDRESVSEDWLVDGLKPVFDKKIENGKYEVTKRDGRDEYRLNVYNKSLATGIKNFQDNPQSIKDLNPDQQIEWASGLFDSQATINATEFKEPTIQLSNESQIKLEQFQKILDSHGIESNIDTSKVNPRLQIRGSSNFKSLKKALKSRHPDKLNELDNAITEAEWYESPERLNYNKERSDHGTRFEKWVGDNLHLLRPGSTTYDRNQLKDGKGEILKPDYPIKNPDGTKEIIEAKLKIDNISDKDREYSERLNFDDTTFLVLEGNKDTNQSRKDNDLCVYKDDMIKTLENNKNKDNESDTDNAINDLESIYEDGIKINEKYSKRPNTSKNSPTKDNDKSIDNKIDNTSKNGTESGGTTVTEKTVSG